MWWHARQSARKQQIMEKTSKIPTLLGCAGKLSYGLSLLVLALFHASRTQAGSCWLVPCSLCVLDPEGAY